MHGLKLYLAIISILLQASCAEIVSRTISSLREGKIRVHYYDGLNSNATPSTSSSTSSPCETIMLIGVGTAMGVGDYDMLSHDVIVGTSMNNSPSSSASSIVVIVMDHNPLWIVKTDAQKYANLALAIVRNITTLVPVCNSKSSPRNGFIIGGHSASGQAAFGALLRSLFLNFKPIGLFGLDPFGFLGLDRSDATTVGAVSTSMIDIPAMYWGFTKTTCLVDVAKAAEYAYEHTSNPKRVLYQVENRAPNREITHCIFTDHGCGFNLVCPVQKSDGWIRTAVADSARRFVAALGSGDFGRSNFVVNNNASSKNPILLFVGQESPKHEPTDPFRIHDAISEL